MGLFLILLWGAAVTGHILRYNSRFGVFNSRLGSNKFPFSPLRELAGKDLIRLAIFGAETALMWNNRKNSRFDGNLPPPERAVAQRATAAICVARADRLVACQPRECSPLRATRCPAPDQTETRYRYRFATITTSPLLYHLSAMSGGHNRGGSLSTGRAALSVNAEIATRCLGRRRVPSGSAPKASASRSSS